MVANTSKTYFFHLKDNPDLEMIELEMDITITCHSKMNIGLKFNASNNIILHMKNNLRDRMFHVNKYYEWQNVNENTPVKIKVQVLYSCMFNTSLWHQNKKKTLKRKYWA